jgi:hypothetical protein
MIRRDAISIDGSPAWILVPQIAHAHLAGDLADAWLFDRSRAAIVSDLRYAARYHDDGWAVWDESPGVDRGRPVNFDEMRLADSLSIWERSIEISTIHAPLAGYLVAGHFCRLLNRFDSWRMNSTTRPLATQFLAAQAAHMDTLLATWKSEDPANRSRELAELGVSFVQLFDAISLWLCCASRQEPWEVKLPDGRGLILRPAQASPGSAQRIAVEPWLLDRPSLILTATGGMIRRVNYDFAGQLRLSKAVELQWELVARR